MDVLHSLAGHHGPPLLAAAEYAVVGILVVLVIGLAGAIIAATHIIGPQRHGRVKDSTYESGMEPIGDTRRRFNVRFYIVAMLFLLFDVEIVFFYPWATLFGRLTAPADAAQRQWSADMTSAGFGAPFFLAEMLIFLAVLAIGYVYAWRKDVFKWD